MIYRELISKIFSWLPTRIIANKKCETCVFIALLYFQLCFIRIWENEISRNLLSQLYRRSIAVRFTLRDTSRGQQDPV